MNKKETFIFKYCDFATAELIVSNKNLKFNNPWNFNDPFDCDIDLLEFNFSEASDEVKAEIEIMKIDLLNRFGESANHSISNLSPQTLEELYKKSVFDKIKRAKICCFSKNMENTVMWSHYADKHNGISLIFDLECQDPFINLKNSSPTQGFVSYNRYKPFNYLKSKVEGITNLFLSKSGDWEYEDEYRYVLLDSEEFQEFKPEFLNGVIFGLGVNQNQIESFKKKCTDHNLTGLKFYKCKKTGLNIAIEMC
jgi:hypothetical protein